MTTPLISLAYLTKYDSFWHEYASDFWLYLWIHRVQEGSSSFVFPLLQIKKNSFPGTALEWGQAQKNRFIFISQLGLSSFFLLHFTNCYLYDQVGETISE